MSKFANPPTLFLGISTVTTEGEGQSGHDSTSSPEVHHEESQWLRLISDFLRCDYGLDDRFLARATLSSSGSPPAVCTALHMS